MKRVEIDISGVKIGDRSPVVIQSMCNTDTNDIEATVNQVIELYNAGSQLVRVTTQGIKEVGALALIKQQIKAKGLNIPLVADVHFSSEVAFAAAKVADKVRINPGNFAKDHNKAVADFRELIAICKEYGTVIRIGINHGSLGERITATYGNTPEGMANAMLEWLNIAIEEEFYSVVLSLKASNTVVMSHAYRLIYNEMERMGVIFPLHLGVTEAGNGDMGRIKSAAGLATLLKDGIGDTIRVSLTENPINEISVARFIANYFKNKKTGHKTQYRSDSWENLILEASCDWAPDLIERKIDEIEITQAYIGEEPVAQERITELKRDIMQASRRAFFKPEYIACPGCGRTKFDLERTFNEVKARTSHLNGMCIAVMGCIVNGPGEMADADWGYVGEGNGKVTIYKGKAPILRSVPQENAIDELLRLIEK